MAFIRKYIVIIICVISVLLHLSSIAFLEFHRDELLYLSLSNHLDLGYASVPPLIGLVAWLSKSIFGFSMLAVKLIPGLLSGMLLYLSTRITKELGGGLYAQVLTAVALLSTPLVLRAYILFQPVPFDIYFWTLIFYFMLKYMNTESDKTLYALGATIGFAILNKYLVVLPIGLLVCILPFTKYRKLFTYRPFYYALGIALLMISPNIYWQVINDFPVVTHMSQLEEYQLQYVSKLTFLSDQILMFHTSILIAITGLGFLLFHRTNRQYWIFGLLFLGVILALMLLGGKAYYSAGIYPFLIAAGSVAVAQYFKSKVARGIVLGVILILILPVIPFGIPILAPEKLASYFDKMESYGVDVGRVHEDGLTHRLPQDYADMMGWRQIADISIEAWNQIEDKSRAAIFAENYGLAGAVSLYGRKHGLPEAISFSDTYEFWAPRSFEPDLTSLIYINDELGEDVEALFDKIDVIGTIEDPLSRQLGTTVYLCSEPNRSFNEFWGEVWQRVDAQ